MYMAEKQEGAKRKRFAWLTKKRKIQLVVILLVLLGLWLAWRQISSPVTGKTVVTESSASLKQSSKKPKTPDATDIKSNYFQLSLPAGYRLQSKSDSVQGLLYQQTLVKPSTMGSVVINIAVKELPAGGLSGDSSYQLRVKNPSKYVMSSESIGGRTVVVASDAQAGAVTAFMTSGGYMATISASSGVSNPTTNDNNATQRKALQPVLEAWRWQ